MTGLFLLALPLVGGICMLFCVKVPNVEYTQVMNSGAIIVLIASVTVKYLSANFLERINKK